MIPLRTLRHWRSLPALLLVFALIFPVVTPSTAALAAAERQSAPPDDVPAFLNQLRSQAPDYADDFETISGDWTSLYDFEVSTYYKGGQRRISIDGEDILAWTRLDTDYTDFYLEVDTTAWEGRSEDLYGVIFRYVDRDNFYIFAIGSDGYYMVRRLVNDEWQYLAEWTESFELEVGDGAVNKLGVMALGNSITVLANDVVLAQVEDDALPEGTVGLIAGAYEEIGVDIGFDNFQLWHLPIESDTPAPRSDRPGRPRATTAPAEPTPTVSPLETPAPEATATPEAEPTAGPEEESPVGADPAAIRRTAPTYHETFDADPTDWIPQLGDDMRYGAVDGALEFGIDRAYALGWTAPPHTTPDYYAEVDTVFSGDVGEAEYGILFRVIDGQNFLFYAINNLGMYSVWRLEGNAWTVLSEWADSSALEGGEGAANRLGVLVQGDRYQVFANDELLGEVVDDTFSGGGLALSVGTFADPGVTITFDDLRVWDLEMQATLPATPVATATPAPEATATPAPEAEPTATPEAETPEEVDAEIAEVQGWVDELLATDPDVFDDFRRDEGNWALEDGEYGEIFYARRALHIKVTSPRSYLFGNYYGFTEDVGPGNFYAEVVVSFVDPIINGQAGFVWREVDNQEFYFAYISAQGELELFKRVDGAWTALYGPVAAKAWDPDADDNRLGVVAFDDLIALVVNGQVEVVTADASLTEGNIGLAAQSSGITPVEVVFDDFMLWQIQE